jgi:tetratricopeptide (TPR) repeat protein
VKRSLPNLGLVLAFLLLLLAPVHAEKSTADSPDMREGLTNFYAGQWTEANAAFEKVLEQDPENTLAISYILHANYKMHNIDGAISEIERKAVARGEDPQMQAHLGMAYFLRGLIIPNVLDEALAEFRAASQGDPQLAMPYTGIGLVYFQKRMMPRAKGYFIRALRLNPHDVMAMDRLGNILLVDENKPQEACQLFERIIAELPTYPDGYYFMGSALFDLKKFEEAIPYLQRSLELDPNGFTQGFDAATLLGDTFLQLGRNQEAAEAFEAAKKIRPDSRYVEIKLKKAHGEED